jgi:hypothetical protein
MIRQVILAGTHRTQSPLAQAQAYSIIELVSMTQPGIIRWKRT